MTIKERVKALMSDGKKRTVREIAMELEPDKEGYDLYCFIRQVRASLDVLEHWEEVEKVDSIPTESNRIAFIWRAVA